MDLIYKGNNSKPNITGVVSDMHVVGSVSPGKVKDLMHVPLTAFKQIYQTAF